jgi:Predicted periplasmic/secreted protein
MLTRIAACFFSGVLFFFAFGAWAQAPAGENEIAFSVSTQAMAQHDLLVVYFSVDERGKDPVQLFDDVESRFANLKKQLQTEAGAEIIFQKISPNRAISSKKIASSAEDGWVVSGSLQASSKDARKMLATIKKIPDKDASMAALSFMMSRETYEQALNDATQDAIKTFRQRAEQMAQALGKKYTVHSLTVTTPNTAVPYQPQLKSDNSPLLACAENRNDMCMIAVTVSGKIKLEP